MSGSARAVPFTQDTRFVPPTRLSGNMKKFKALKNRKVKEKVKFIVEGNVEDIRADEEVETIGINITSVENA